MEDRHIYWHSYKNVCMAPKLLNITKLNFLLRFLIYHFSGTMCVSLFCCLVFFLFISYFIHIKLSSDCRHKQSWNNGCAAKWFGSLVLSGFWIKIYIFHIYRDIQKKTMFYLNCTLCAAILLNSCHIPHHWMIRWKSNRNCTIQHKTS